MYTNSDDLEIFFFLPTINIYVGTKLKMCVCGGAGARLIKILDKQNKRVVGYGFVLFLQKSSPSLPPPPGSAAYDIHCTHT